MGQAPEDSLCFQVFNDLPVPTSGVIQIALKDFTGRVLRQPFSFVERRQSTVINLVPALVNPLTHT